MSKKMTTTIAKALAEKVRAKLAEQVSGTDTKIRKTVVASKEWKQYLKIYAEKKAIIEKANALEKEIKDKYTTNVAKVDVYTYSNSGPELRVYENQKVVSIDSIKDTILIEDYLSGGTETAEQMIERITQQLLNS